MARDYGRISTAFWNSPDIRPLSDRGKLLASYLLTGPHSNMIGAYLLPDAYVADDLGWDAVGVRETLSELFGKGFAVRFKDGRHIVVCKYLEWNPVENPNVAIASLKMADQLPDDAALIHVLNGLRLYEKHFRNGLETLSERLGKPFRNMEQEQEMEQEQDLQSSLRSDLSAKADASPHKPVIETVEAEVVDEPSRPASTPEIVSRETPQPDLLAAMPGFLLRDQPTAPAVVEVTFDPVVRALEAYHRAVDYAVERGANWSRCVLLSDARRKSLKRRLDECGGLQGWCELMAKAIQSSHLLGKTKRSDEFKNWKVGLDFFLQPKSFNRLREGFYDDAPGSPQGGGADALDAGFARAAAVYGD